MSKKAQAGAITAVFTGVVYAFFYTIWIGDVLATYSAEMVARADVTGLEAFLWAYLRLWVNLGVLLALAFVARFG